MYAVYCLGHRCKDTEGTLLYAWKSLIAMYDFMTIPEVMAEGYSIKRVK